MAMEIVAVAELGYVRLPLTVEFGTKQHTIDYDLSNSEIQHYQQHFVKLTSTIYRQTSLKPKTYPVLNPHTLSRKDWNQP